MGTKFHTPCAMRRRSRRQPDRFSYLCVGGDDRRWTIDDGRWRSASRQVCPIVHGLSSIVWRREMPRRGRYEKHAPIPDARYNNLVVTKFINKLMERGKKGRAEQLFYGTLDEMERRAKRPGIEVFEQAM